MAIKDDRKDYSKIRLTATKAIREKCLDCCGRQEAEVRNCTVVKCPLWRYRMGREQRDELYTRTTRGNSGFLKKEGE